MAISRQTIWAFAVLAAFLVCVRNAAAASPAVTVKFAATATEFDVIKEGVQAYSNKNYAFNHVPSYLQGLTFTRRRISNAEGFELDAASGATVYLLVDVMRDVGLTEAPHIKFDQSLTGSGWKRLDEVATVACAFHPNYTIYKKVFEHSQHVLVTAVVPDRSVIVLAANLASPSHVLPGTGADQAAASVPRVHLDSSTGDAPVLGPTTRIANQQATVKSLEIYETDSGMMLGQTAEVTLTATRSETPKLTSVHFVTPVCDDMSLARDEALRFIRLTYPNWNVANADLTFEDKYVAHDGGSIGAAIGTLVGSVIEGFQIDPDCAITGDISANGKIRAIGGVAAKLRGAIESKCTIVAIPTDNYDQLVDAVTYGGSDTVTNVQVIGISNLADAKATLRTDRAEDLQQAITQFAILQNDIKTSPDFLKRKTTADSLLRVLELAPQHMSARVLLAIALGKQPRTLSATASKYYAFLAGRSMIDALKSREDAKTSTSVPSTVVRSGLTDLHKLRPLADPKIRPLVDAWIRFVQTWSDFQQGSGSTQSVENSRQALLDEMAHEQADTELMQKMLKEGM